MNDKPIDDQTRMRYITACASWLFGGVLLFFCASTFLLPFNAGVIAQVAQTAYLRNESYLAALSNFPGWISTSANLIASMTVVVCAFCLAKVLLIDKDGAQPPLAPFFLRTQPPLRKLGITACILVVIVFCARSGMDIRHAYLLGIAAAGIGLMFAIATIPFAFVKPLKEHAIATAGKGTSKPRFILSTCLIQSAGTALVLFAATSLLASFTYAPLLSRLSLPH
jgi:hypothetical protein